MASLKILITGVLFNIVHGGDLFKVKNVTERSKAVPQTCGLDNSPITVVYHGLGVIQTYPWLGTLYYPRRGDKRFTTTVVLVTKQVVIGSAIDIDKMPKTDFRARSRVVLGANCNGPSIRVREYSYHPAYKKTTYSAIALIQLETAYLTQELRPICPPPSIWNNPKIYAVALDNDCENSQIRIYEMNHVSPEKCRSFYTKTNLDVESMWPTDTVCASSVYGEECIWRNGAVLMLRQDNRWSLMGFGVSGPGCRAPARFIDYSINRYWVQRSVARIGRPSVTRIARNQLVMRRTTSNLQRFGHCDPEEIKAELFMDDTSISATTKLKTSRIRYNFTMISKMEYSCIVFRADRPRSVRQPYIRLRRWCTSPRPICYASQYLQIDFYVEIYFAGDITYEVAAYGEEARVIDMKKAVAYTNKKRPLPETNMGFSILLPVGENQEREDGTKEEEDGTKQEI